MFTPKEEGAETGRSKEEATVVAGAESTEKRRVKVKFGAGTGGIDSKRTRVYSVKVRRYVNDTELRGMRGSREVILTVSLSESPASLVMLLGFFFFKKKKPSSLRARGSLESSESAGAYPAV